MSCINSDKYTIPKMTFIKSLNKFPHADIRPLRVSKNYC
jgi:hypothetical protein